jgi:hypothetical protein
LFLVALGCGAVDEVSIPIDAQPAAELDAPLAVGAGEFDPYSCSPAEKRALHRHDGFNAVMDVLPPWLEGLPSAANNLSAANSVALNPESLLPQAQRRTFVVHSFPFDHVRVSPAGIQALSWSPTGQPNYPLHDAVYDDPGLAPVLPPEKDPYGWADEYLKPMLVVAAKQIELSGEIDMEDRAIALIAETIKVAPGTKIRSWIWPDWTGPNNEAAHDNPLHPGQVYIIANRLELATRGSSGRRGARAVPGTLTVEAASDLDDGGFWKYPMVSGHVAILTVQPVAVSSIPGATDEVTAGGGVNAMVTIRTITPATFGNLLNHYAPSFQRRAYSLAEAAYQKRNVPLAKPFYESVLEHGGKHADGAASRLQQLEAGLNYLGENDNVLPQENVEALLDDAEATITSLNFMELKYLYAVGDNLDTEETVSQLNKLKESQAEEIAIADTRYQAAADHVAWAKAKVAAEKDKLAALTAQQVETFDGIGADFEAFKAKVNSGACLPETDWWDVIVSAVTFIVDVFTLDFSGIADSFGSMFNSLQALEKSLKGIYETAGPAVKKGMSLISDIESIADSLDGLSDELESKMKDASASYTSLYTQYSGAGVSWDPANGGDGDCSYPKVAYPIPFEMKTLENEILATAAAIKLAAIQLEEAKKLLQGAQLQVEHAQAEKERTEAFSQEVQQNAAALAAGFVIPFDADNVSVAEQLCHVGQRMVDRLVRTSYDAARGMAYLGLKVKNCGPAQGDAVANLCSNTADVFAPKNFKFAYSFYNGSHHALKNWVGVAETVGLKQQFYQLAQSLGPSELLQITLGTSAAGIVTNSLEEVIETGLITVDLDAQAQAIAGLGPVRVQDVQVILHGAESSIRMVPERAGANVYHVLGKTDVVVPLQNIQRARDVAQNWILTDQSLATVPPPGPILEQVFEPLFGMSLEGSWHIRLDPRVPANANPAEVLAGITGVTVVFRIFGG